MSISKDEYSKMTDKASPNSPVLLNCVKAFLFGGAICCFGQLLNFLFEKAGMTEEQFKIATPCIIVIITAILTGIGVFDKIARQAGAGIKKKREGTDTLPLLFCGSSGTDVRRTPLRSRSTYRADR